MLRDTVAQIVLTSFRAIYSLFSIPDKQSPRLFSESTRKADFRRLFLCSRQESNSTSSVPQLDNLFRSSQIISIGLRHLTNSLPDCSPVATIKKHPLGVLFDLCSRQESNLQHWYRKPIFYPLNYGSKSHPLHATK